PRSSADSSCRSALSSRRARTPHVAAPASLAVSLAEQSRRARRGAVREVMMKKLLLALTLVSVPAFTAPAASQTREEQQRWEAAQARYDSETDLYQRERERYMAARARDRGYGRDRYEVAP